VAETLEETLRDALSKAVPEPLPTIGVRAKLIDSIHERRRRRQQLVGGIAAACVIIGGIAIGVTASGHGASKSAAPSISAGLPQRPRANSQIPSTSNLPRPDCAEATIGAQATTGCWGTFSRTSNAYESANTPNDAAASNSAASLGQSTRDFGEKRTHTARNLEIVVSLGTPVTIELPGSSGDIWTAPAVAPGQGAEANNVQTISESASNAGGSASATFESRSAVTVVVEASEFAVCGSEETPCGDQEGTWSMVIEFQAT
jgi:hypothetical protein